MDVVIPTTRLDLALDAAALAVRAHWPEVVVVALDSAGEPRTAIFAYRNAEAHRDWLEEWEPDEADLICLSVDQVPDALSIAVGSANDETARIVGLVVDLLGRIDAVQDFKGK